MGLERLPDVRFCDTDAETVEKSIITVYEGLANTTLFNGDPVRLFLEALAAVVVQQRNLIDHTGKQNLLKYAAGEALDNLGAMTDTTRLPAAPALTTMRFSLPAALSHVVAVPQGTRISPDGTLMFETTAYKEIDAGALYVDIHAKCQTPGTIGNHLLPGQISKMVDPVAYVSGVANTTTTAGGVDTETDEPYRLRIQMAPESFSVAGPALAYAHHAKSAHQDIADVAVYRSSGLDEIDRAGLETILGVFGISDTNGMTDEQVRIAAGNQVKASVVNICPLLRDGEIPDQAMLDLVSEKTGDRTVRPLTDQVIVKAPAVIDYDIELTYYIRESDRLMVSEIQTAVATAVDGYVAWQKSVLGRDINPDQLVSMLVNASVHRTDLAAPVYTAANRDQVAVARTVTINYGGLVSE